jgi:ribose transport system permease protein
MIGVLWQWSRQNRRLARGLSSYGMLGILLLLCAFFSLVTLKDQHPTGAGAAADIMRQLGNAVGEGDSLAIASRPTTDDLRFVETLQALLAAKNVPVAGIWTGEPVELRRAVLRTHATRLVILTLHGYAPVVDGIVRDLPDSLNVTTLTPRPHRWPTFLLTANLLNVANQIAVIAILAIGMTMVIITGGIDLSVGSLIALAAVAAAGFGGRFGGETASASVMLAGGLAAMLICGASGAFSGLVITRFKVPPFIATLGMMQVASGLAYILSQGKPIYQVPETFVKLGRGVDPLLGIPYAVVLMIVLYLLAHLMMTRTVLGRYIYAVGGNPEAARLAGVRHHAVLMFVYTASGMLAGLGGVIMASQLRSGAPTYGLMYELYVIAAVVVGGTSLSGGQGRILGTLIGAFIIAVIQNGMNLTNVESYTQKVVLGLVILGAVLLDRLKRR